MGFADRGKSDAKRRPDGDGVRLRVGFVLAHQFTLTAFAGFVDALRLASDDGDQSRQIRCRWTVMSASGHPVRASCGVEVCRPTAWSTLTISTISWSSAGYCPAGRKSMKLAGAICARLRPRA